VERWGGRRAVALGMITGAVLLAGVGTVPSAIVVAVLWAMSGMASQLVLVGVNSLALSSTENRGGAVSVVQACRFLGAAVTPAAFTPVYHASALTSFLLPAGLLVAGTPTVLLTRPASEHHAE
jgi:sugar phosphate permease